MQISAGDDASAAAGANAFYCEIIFPSVGLMIARWYSFSPACLVSVCTRRYLNPCIYISSLLYILLSSSVDVLVDLSRARCVLCGITNLFCKLQTRASLTTIVHALRWYRYKSEAHHLSAIPASERVSSLQRREREWEMLRRWRTRAFGPSQVPPKLSVIASMGQWAICFIFARTLES
jgi:hypothetical protein